MIRYDDKRRPVLLSHCLGPHYICFLLQAFVIIDGHTIFELHRWLYPTLFLLRHVPGFVRQVLLLSRCDVYIRSLGICQCLQLRWFVGVIVYLHVVHGLP